LAKKVTGKGQRTASGKLATAKSTPSEVHSRTRSDHSVETAEDYVEAIAEIGRGKADCRISDLAKYFGVSHVTVHRIIARLQGEGLVDTQPYRPVVLTRRGAEVAARSQKRHEIVYRFLLSLGVSTEIAIQDAEGIEHHVSPQTLQKMEAWMANA
jgi:DtxR family manganese transport transcriptional regulator